MLFRAFEKLNNFAYEGSQLSVSWRFGDSNLCNKLAFAVHFLEYKLGNYLLPRANDSQSKNSFVLTFLDECLLAIKTVFLKLHLMCNVNCTARSSEYIY